MTFDSLINLNMPESEIFHKAVAIIQHRFSADQNVVLCLPISLLDGDLCHVTEVIYFREDTKDGVHQRREYLISGEYNKIFIMSQFRKNHYHVALFGHHSLMVCEIYVDTIGPLHSAHSTTDAATMKQPCLKLAELAFGEISEELTKKSLK